MRGGRFMSVEDIIFLMRKDKVGFINSNCCDVCKIDTQLQLYIHWGYNMADTKFLFSCWNIIIWCVSAAH